MPAIGYPGGKARLANKIISFLPKQGRTYVEPFAGRGNLFWAAVERGLKFRQWWLNDIATAPFFEAIKKFGDKIEVPPSSRAEFERYREAHKSGDLAAVLLSPYLSFAGGFYDSGFQGGSGFGGVSRAGYERALRECHRILTRTRPKITALDWCRLGLEKLTEDDVVVLDPPYPNSNIRSYTHESVDYERLVDVLLRAKFRWLLCGYLHPVLHRLGNPIWARDLQVLCVREQRGRDERTECLWSNFSPNKNKSHHLLPPGLDAKLLTMADAASLSFPALNERIDEGLETVAKDWTAVVPYLLEMNRRLSAPGKRTDLRRDAPAGLTWTAWVESKRIKLGRSLRSVQRLLRGKTEASKNWRRRPHDILSSGSEMIAIIPGSAMGIAFQMARLILEMRSRSRNTSSNKRKLERLASQFLSVAERRSQQRSDSIPAERIAIANRTSGGVTLTM
jgi:site-specific DNA-adenine methylase